MGTAAPHDTRIRQYRPMSVIGTQRRRAGGAAPPELRRRAVALNSTFITSRALLPRPLPLLIRSASHLSLIYVDPARSGEESASYQMICKLWSMLPLSSHSLP
jgi:hypothetical protein